jgi:hypothetical protein
VRSSARRARRRIVVFGAFDRHNLGDLLFAHVAGALLRRRGTAARGYAGLAARDLRACDGHEVSALSTLLASADSRPLTLLHAGGELLTCDAWRAAVMLLAPHEVPATVAWLESRPAERALWIRQRLGSDSLAPYTASLPPGSKARVIYNAAGGVDLDRCDAALRAEVLARLRAADAVSVRDRVTLGHLRAAGVRARLAPDAAWLVAELFSGTIAARAAAGALAGLPQRYLALQFSAEFGDDRTLETLAAQLDHVAAATGFDLVLFRAGAAPWHDDAAVYRRLCGRLRRAHARLFESIALWDLCALVAASRGYCGSSLHGRIVAAAYALPRVNVLPADARQPSKQSACADCWEPEAMPGAVTAEKLAAATLAALALPARPLRAHAAALAWQCRADFDALLDAAL